MECARLRNSDRPGVHDACVADLSPTYHPDVPGSLRSRDTVGRDNDMISWQRYSDSPWLAWLVLASACSNGGAPARDATTDTIRVSDASQDASPFVGDAAPDAAPEVVPDLCQGAARGTVCGQNQHCVDDRCLLNRCGDLVAAGAEECDDGNLRAEDGCDPDCKAESCATQPNAAVDAECEGHVMVDVSFNQCPRIVSYTAAPSQVKVGGRMNLYATAEDADSDAIKFDWQAKDGRFGNAKAPQTTYRCTHAGAKVLKLLVTDRRGCTDSAKIRVTCVDLASSVGAGIEHTNGVTDPVSP